MNRSLFNRQLLGWYDKHRRIDPWSTHWERYKDPYPVWLSEIMLQQTTIQVVTERFHKFLERFPTIESVASVTFEEIQPYVAGMGYYRRFRYFHKGCQEIFNRSQAAGVKIDWPTTYDEWLEISGIGPYCAASISSIVNDVVEPVVDGNVERVFSRLYCLQEPINANGMKKKFRSLTSQIIPNRNPGAWNQALMQLGQLVCRPGTPDCSLCPISTHCQAYQSKTVDKFPVPKIKKQKSKDVSIALLLHQGSKGFALLKRPHNAKFLKNELGFPTFVKDVRSWKYDGDERIKASLIKKTKTVIGSFRHAITNHKIHAEVWQVDTLPPGTDIEKWVSAHELQEQLIAGLDKKALKYASTH